MGMQGFSKFNYLFNLARARATPCHSVILVEGAPDVLRLAEAGLVGVALLGSEATDLQIQTLVGLGKTILVAFDNDAGGQRAGERFWTKVGGQGVTFMQWGVPAGFKDLAEMTADSIRTRTPVPGRCPIEKGGRPTRRLGAARLPEGGWRHGRGRLPDQDKATVQGTRR
ncbi:toprim domain-containing protein [Tautonia plasticadhaerens]|uniref:DNA primase n=1 Tax=Tautonia plasticadhaerens TaxID=2527974 RepID=A0A518HEE9_9BACT|nr:toprim domain-containing protein [Tautonia plasticadhaerens]QDV39212.1 DNA primase [Tautonia plasticadhaerens]